MNFITKTLAGLAATATVCSPVMAGTFEEHTELARAVASTGVELLINVPACQTKDAYGWYDSSKSQLVICQENATGSEMVSWTAEDLDTLRHEAHHLVQDCIDNVLDGDLETVYVEPDKLIGAVLTKVQIMEILEWYEDATDTRKLMELEAFSVAIMNDPLEQVDDIQRYCF
tara:strand:- start:1415 stop:1930 length:516 start_codon:yes stop_codon:yes gene_type:complete